MSGLPDFAITVPLAFLIFGAFILLWGLAYARPAQFDGRARLRWRRKLAMAQMIPFSTSRSDEEVSRYVNIGLRTQRISNSLYLGMMIAVQMGILTDFFTPFTPAGFSAIAGGAIILPAFLLLLMLPMQVKFPKVALTEAA